MTIRTEVKTMALKNLFEMVKADRYTQDGREAIIKAQEAETEDKVYNIGDISQKTGLQKTANGWVKPKNGKQPGAASKHDTDPQTYIVKKNDELRKMYLNEKDPAKKEAMKKALKKQASMMEPEPFSSTESKPGAKAETKSSSIKIDTSAAQQKLDELTKNKASFEERNKVAEQIKAADEYNYLVENLAKRGDKPTEEMQKKLTELKAKAESKPAGESKPAETPKAPKPSAQEYMKAKQRVKAYEDQYKKDMDDYEYMERIKANGVDPSIFNPMYGGKPKPLEENKSYMEELNKIKAYEAEDAAYTAQSINAPREKLERTLTGDTRIRVRK